MIVVVVLATHDHSIHKSKWSLIIIIVINSIVTTLSDVVLVLGPIKLLCSQSHDLVSIVSVTIVP